MPTPIARVTLMYSNFLDRLAPEHATISQVNGHTVVSVQVEDPTPAELRRIAQHLLQLAGMPVADAVRAVNA